MLHNLSLNLPVSLWHSLAAEPNGHNLYAFRNKIELKLI